MWIAVCAACADSPATHRAHQAPAAPASIPEIIPGVAEPPLVFRPGSLKFAVIGDSGQWSTAQRDAAARLAAERDRFRFDFVLMLGDNNYGDGSAESYRRRFEEPYAALIDAGVRFYAALGNHDPPGQPDYPLFNMGGERYYTFERRSGLLPPLAGERVQFFALDSGRLDEAQLTWFDRQLDDSRAEWKIVFLHHPIYSSGRYAMSSAARRQMLEGLLADHRVDVVFAGHEHLYERMAPQRGVLHFVCGASGSVREGDLQETSHQAAGYDRDLTFMLIEIAGDTLYFRAVTRAGETVDAGRLVRKRPSS